MQKWLELLRAVIDAVNGISANVWAIAIIAFGVLLMLKGKPEAGTPLVTLGGGIFQHGVNKS